MRPHESRDRPQWPDCGARVARIPTDEAAVVLAAVDLVFLGLGQ